MKTQIIPQGGGSTEINNFYNEVVSESTGFEDPTASSISFNDGTRTFQIQPTGDSFVFYAFGTRYEKISAETIQIDDVAGLWYIYYTSAGVLGASQTIWDLSTQVPVATVLWNGAAGDIGDEKNKGKTDPMIPIYVIGISAPGTYDNDQLISMHLVSGSENVELRKQLPYSNIKCKTAPTGSISFDIQINQVSKGSGNIGASQTTGDFTWNNKITLTPGDWVEVYAPDTADATLENVAISLVGIRII